MYSPLVCIVYFKEKDCGAVVSFERCWWGFVEGMHLCDIQELWKARHWTLFLRPVFGISRQASPSPICAGFDVYPCVEPERPDDANGELRGMLNFHCGMINY